MNPVTRGVKQVTLEDAAKRGLVIHGAGGGRSGAKKEVYTGPCEGSDEF